MGKNNMPFSKHTGLFSRHDASVLDTHFAPDYKQHNPMIKIGGAGLKEVAPKLSPNLKYEPGMIVEEGDIVMIHGRYVGLRRSGDLCANVPPPCWRAAGPLAPRAVGYRRGRTSP